MAGGPQWLLNCDRWAVAAADGWTAFVHHTIRKKIKYVTAYVEKYVLIMSFENNQPAKFMCLELNDISFFIEMTLKTPLLFYYLLPINIISKIRNCLWAPVCFKQSKTVFDHSQ